MQQQAFLNKSARKTLLSSVLVIALFLFAGVSSMVAQNWVPAAEASVKSSQEATTLRTTLVNFQPGTLEYEQVVRKMTMYNRIVENLKIEANVALAVDLAVASAYTVTFDTPPAAQPVKGEAAAGRAAAVALLQ